jgi:hypothetical protein
MFSNNARRMRVTKRKKVFFSNAPQSKVFGRKSSEMTLLPTLEKNPKFLRWVENASKLKSAENLDECLLLIDEIKAKIFQVISLEQGVIKSERSVILLSRFATYLGMYMYEYLYIYVHFKPSTWISYICTHM